MSEKILLEKDKILDLKTNILGSLEGLKEEITKTQENIKRLFSILEEYAVDRYEAPEPSNGKPSETSKQEEDNEWREIEKLLNLNITAIDRETWIMWEKEPATPLQVKLLKAVKKEGVPPEKMNRAQAMRWIWAYRDKIRHRFKPRR